MSDDADDEAEGRRPEDRDGEDGVDGDEVDDTDEMDDADEIDGTGDRSDESGLAGGYGDGSSDGTSDGERSASGNVAAPAGSTDEDRPGGDPLSEFDEPDDDLAELFSEVAVEDVDAQAVWSELDASGSPGTGDGAASDDHFEVPDADAVLREGADEAVVSKASYCQRCEYFSSPPDVGCSHPGTEIVELVDVKHFRVRNCPVVAQRRGATVSNLDRDDGYGSGGGDDGDPEDDGGPDRQRDPDPERYGDADPERYGDADPER